MTTKAEKIGAALAKAVKASTGITSAKLGGAHMYRTNIRDVPKVEGLKRSDGWIDMQVQFLIDKKSAGADHVVGWTVLKPGASHECHLHRNCDEFFIVLKGKGRAAGEHWLAESALHLDRGESAEIHAEEQTELVYIGLPNLDGLSVPVHHKLEAVS